MIDSLQQEEFDTKVLQADKPVVLEIWGRRCPHCEKLDPVFKKLGEEYGDEVRFYQLLANDNIELARRLKVFGVPTLLFFNHGVLVDKMRGFQSAAKIKSKVEKMKNYTPEQARENPYKPLLKRLFGKK